MSKNLELALYDKKKLGKILRERRIKLGYSQKQIVQMLGLEDKYGGSYVSHIEAGDMLVPEKQIIKYARILKIDPIPLIVAKLKKLIPEELLDYVDIGIKKEGQITTIKDLIRANVARYFQGKEITESEARLVSNYRKLSKELQGVIDQLLQVTSKRGLEEILKNYKK